MTTRERNQRPHLKKVEGETGRFLCVMWEKMVADRV